MGETTQGGPKPGPALTDTVHEVQGRFPDDATLQAALGKLTLAGFDRADFSLPEEQPDATQATPNESAENPNDRTDKAQVRTIGTSMAGYAGAVGVAAATVATGGAAGLAAAAAAAVGLGSAAAAHAAGQAADQANVDERNRKGAEGRLILAVRTTTPEQAEQVIGLMREAGAVSAEPVVRREDLLTAGISSASWTGG